jgi:hypothetical protein
VETWRKKCVAGLRSGLESPFIDFSNDRHGHFKERVHEYNYGFSMTLLYSFTMILTRLPRRTEQGFKEDAHE